MFIPLLMMYQGSLEKQHQKAMCVLGQQDTHIYIYIHIYVYIHTHTHIHMYKETEYRSLESPKSAGEAQQAADPGKS